MELWEIIRTVQDALRAAALQDSAVIECHWEPRETRIDVTLIYHGNDDRFRQYLEQRGFYVYPHMPTECSPKHFIMQRYDVHAPMRIAAPTR